MHAVGYARISTEEQSNYSIDGQIADITAYCKRNNLNLQKIFIEDGQTAFNFNRKEWKDLESYIKHNREVKYLVVIDMDRFSRADLAQALAKMEEVQRRLNVKILTVTDPVDLDIDDFGTDLRRIVELLFANYELKKIRKRTAHGIYTGMLSGRFMAKAPFGYINSRDENGKPILLINEDKAYIIRLIYRLYLSGMEIEEVRKHAVANGMSIKGNSVIQKILSNPVYAGLIFIKKYRDQPAKMVKGLHPPIISESDFWLAQQHLNKKQKAVKRRDTVYLVSVLHCPECGKRLTTDNVRGKAGKHYQYYLCNNHRKYLSVKKMHLQMDRILLLLSIPENSIKAIGDKLKAKIDEKLNNKGGDLMRAKMNLQKIQDKIEATQTKYLTQPDISESVYKRVITGLKADEHRLLTEVAQLNSVGRDYYSVMDDLLPQLSNIPELFHNMPLYKKQGFLRLVFGNFLSYRDGIYRTPYLHPMFAYNELEFKEKGLLIIEQPEKKTSGTPFSDPSGNWLEHLLELWRLLAA